MCHGDDARDVNPVEINLVEDELPHKGRTKMTFGTKAERNERFLSPCGGRVTMTA